MEPDLAKIKALLSGVDKDKGPWKRRYLRSVRGGNVAQSNQRKIDPHDTEAVVQREVIVAALCVNLTLWRQNAGKIWAGRHPIQLAPAGAGDLTGILPDGRRLEVECKKRHGGRQSEVQKKWQKFVEDNRGVYLLVSSGVDFREKIGIYLTIPELGI